MTYDAKFVYEDIAKGVLGDWQSPVMTVLWRVIDPIAPGPASMFLLIATAYWLAFGLLALALVAAVDRARAAASAAGADCRRPSSSPGSSGATCCLRSPGCWPVRSLLLPSSAALLRRLSLQALALALCGFGVLLRPNALIAAPLLAAYTIWPDQFSWKRTAILFVPAMAAFFAPGAGHLLRRARSRPAASAAIDHGVRPRRHQPFLPSRTSFPSAGMSPRPRCS